MSGRTDYRIIRAAESRVRGTQTSVWLIEHLRRSGVSLDVVLDEYPALCREDVFACWEYADEHPEEMSRLICENLGE